MHSRTKFLVVLLILASLVSCKQKAGKDLLKSDNFQKSLQEKFINAQAGDVIELPEGKFLLSSALSVEGIDNLTIKGAGKDKTILSFKGQVQGAEGLNISNCNNIVLEDFGVEDAKGDNIKLKNCDGLTLRNLNSTWTTGADTSNGNYGYYPVECRNVLLENCEVSYCADAGVYVGQSTNVVVRNCYAHHNVAGIEIENCINSNIYDNLSENNSGGILVFDLPKLFQGNGRNAKVYNNKCIGNNFKNFGKPGSIVALIPPGSGMIVMATDSVDIFNNEFINNKTVGVSVVSYIMTGKVIQDSTYGPYCHTIYIHDNKFERKGVLNNIPDMSTDLGKLFTATFKGSVDICYDNINDPKIRDANGDIPADKRLCIGTNTGMKKFGNLNAWKAKKPTDIPGLMSTDISKYMCSYTRIRGFEGKL
jgi:parallel beta-helix repeat protein